MLKMIIRRAFWGFSVGILAGDGIAMLTGSLNAGELVLVSDKVVNFAGSLALAVVIQTVLSGLYGAITFGTTVFYEIESWSLMIATALHCLVVVGLFVPLSMFLGWGSDDPISYLIMIAFQVTGFFLIWLIMYLIYRKQVKELNELQDSYLKKQ